MIHINGNLIEADEETAIGHGVNTMGAMAAGIAAGVRNKYPAINQPYVLACASGDLTPGGFTAYATEDGRVVYNLASQERPGADASYHWLMASLLLASDDLKERGLNRIALPRIGCGIGGLDWSRVEWLLELVEILTDIEIAIYTYTP